MAAAAPVPCTDLILHPTVSHEDEEEDERKKRRLKNGGQKFVGLSNQGATCYMNSLLQTLFMTAEFRHGLYKWRYDREKDGDEEYCIPLQLQRLFGLLQLSSSRSVDTLALTKSFGWEGNERFQQQDVQELCRVLFDALEESFKGHPEVENFIDELYAGELIDYIKCMDIDYQSERKDKFLDYSVAIRPFGAEESMKSLTECIEHYLEPEILDGDNQYYAEKEDKKVDAIKGLKFGKLPQVMSVQMKRFVFDFSGGSIVQKKINDKVKFPLFLDMNKYISSRRTRSGSSTESEVDDFDYFLKKRIGELRSRNNVNSCSEDDLPDLVDCNGVKIPESNNLDASLVEEHFEKVDPLKVIEEKGEWVYHLFAVLVHSGAISGGHYYVYIRDEITNKWWNFNDSHVTEVTEKDVLEAQGGFVSSHRNSSNGYVYQTSRPVESCANAYMLMYRKVSPEGRVLSFPGDDLVPDYIREEVKKIADEEEKKRKELEERNNRLFLAVHWKGKKHDIQTTKNSTLYEFLQLVWTHLHIAKDDENHLFDHLQCKDVPPLESIRLRAFNQYYKIAGQVFDSEASKDRTLDQLNISSYQELVVEVKSRDAEWEPYEADGIVILLSEFDPDLNYFKADTKAIRISRQMTVGELRKSISDMTTTCVERIRILQLSIWCNDVKSTELLGDDLQLVSQFKVHEGQKLYWEEATGPMEESKAVQAFRSNANKMTFNVREPYKNGNSVTTVTADKTWDLAQLRCVLESELGLEGDFRVCRFHHPQEEIQGEKGQSLASLGFFSGTTLLIKLGPPLQPGYVNFKVFIYRSVCNSGIKNVDDESAVVWDNVDAKRSNDVESATDVEGCPAVDTLPGSSSENSLSSFGSERIPAMPSTNQFESLMDIPCSADTKVSEIRSAVHAELVKKKLLSDTTSISRLRIRIKNGMTCGDILHESLTLKQCHVPLYPEKHIAVQILDSDENISPIDVEDAVVIVQKWQRSTWSLTPPVEFLLKGSLSVQEIATSLAKLYKINFSTMKVLLVHPYSNLYLCDLHLQEPSRTSQWVDPTRETRTLRGVNWRLDYGDYLIIQDQEEPLKVLTDAEQQSISQKGLSCSARRDDAVPAMPAADIGSLSYYPCFPARSHQKGIVIKTQRAREEEREKNEIKGALAAATVVDERQNVGGSDLLFGDLD